MGVAQFYYLAIMLSCANIMSIAYRMFTSKSKISYNTHKKSRMFDNQNQYGRFKLKFGIIAYK